MSDDEIIAGIVSATDDDSMPRMVQRFEAYGVVVDIVEPVMPAQDDQPARRGYLYHAIAGSYVLEPALLAGAFDDAPVPGGARLLAGAELLSMSKTQAGAVRGARRKLRQRAATTAPVTSLLSAAGGVRIQEDHHVCDESCAHTITLD